MDTLPALPMGIHVTKKTKTGFANLLKDWHTRHGITQSEAAEVLGVTVRTLRNWEIARTAPHSSLRQILASRLQLPVANRSIGFPIE